MRDGFEILCRLAISKLFWRNASLLARSSTFPLPASAQTLRPLTMAQTSLMAPTTLPCLLLRVMTSTSSVYSETRKAETRTASCRRSDGERRKGTDAHRRTNSASRCRGAAAVAIPQQAWRRRAEHVLEAAEHGEALRLELPLRAAELRRRPRCRGHVSRRVPFSARRHVAPNSLEERAERLRRTVHLDEPLPRLRHGPGDDGGLFRREGVERGRGGAGEDVEG
mmetsp:Transcript_18310/g.63007  ORF Transcript_18310/g.63007 Transcript_18310/m.63007 type:complete len:224 (+) Transcript_18310:1512-2183(+)